MRTSSTVPEANTPTGTSQRGPAPPPEPSGPSGGDEACDPTRAAIKKGLEWLFEKLKGDRR